MKNTKTRRSFNLILVEVLVLCTLSSTALAIELPSCPPDPISFGLYENGYIYDSSKNSGIDKSLAVELGKRSQCQFSFRESSRARIWADLKSGRLMMSGSGIQTSVRDEFAWFIRCMGQKNYVVIWNDVNIRTARDFLDSDIQRQWGVIRAYKHGHAADEFLNLLRIQGRINDVRDMDQLFQLLSVRRLIAGFAPPPVYSKYIDIYDVENQLTVKDWFPEDRSIPHALIFSKKHFSASDMKKWRAIVSSMKSDGTLKKIYSQFLGQQGAIQMMDYSEIKQKFE